MYGQTPSMHQVLVDAYRVVLSRMQSRNPALPMSMLVALCGGALAPTAQAAIQYWDTNGNVAGSGNTGGGWGGSNWTASSTGTTATTTWSGASTDANFSAGTDGTGSLTIDLGAAQSIGNLTVDEGSILLTTSGSLAFNTNSLWTTAVGTNLTLTRGLAMGTKNWTLANAGNITISGNITGTNVTIAKDGLGTLLLTGDNSGMTISGNPGIKVTNGVLSISADTQLGAVPGSVANTYLALGKDTNNATLRVTSTMTLSSNRGITMGSANAAETGTFEITGNNTLTYGGVIDNWGASTHAGGDSMAKTGTGTMVLSGTNLYAGTTTVKDGILRLDFAAGGTSNILNPVSYMALAGGTLDIKGGSGEADTQTFGDTSGSGVMSITRNGATSVNVTLGTVSGTGSINFVGGTTTVSGGVATAGNANFITTTTVGSNNGATRLGAMLWNGDNWASTAKDSGTTTYVVGWTGAYTDIYNGTTSGTVVVPNTATAQVRILESTGGYANNTLAAATTTIDSLLMTAAGHDAAINMSTNTLVVGNGAGATGAIAITGSGKSLTIGTAANQGFLTAGTSAAASTLALNNQNADAMLTVNSVIKNNGSGGVVSLVTNGNVTLTGTNTYTGTTTASNGLLNVTGSLTSAMTVAAGATLAGQGGSTSSTLALQGGSSIIGVASVAGAGNMFRAAGAVTAGNTVTVLGTDGSATVGSHTIDVVGYGTTPGLANFNTAAYYRYGATLADDTVNKKITLTYTNATRTWNSAAGTWDHLNSTSWQEGDKMYASGDVVVFDDTGTGGGGVRAVTLDETVTPGSVTFNNATSTYTVGGIGSISGATTLTQSGSGTTTLGTNNTYTGTTTVSGGVLVLANTGALSGGAAGSGGGTGSDLVINGGVVGLGTGNTAFTRALGAAGSAGVDTVNFSGSGGFAAYGSNASVNLGGAGATLTWNSTANFLATGQNLVLGTSGATATVDFQNAIALNGAQRTVQVGDGSATVDAILSGGLTGVGSSGLNKTGTGTLALTGTNSYSGDTHVTAGVLNIGNGTSAGTLATGTVAVDSGTTLTISDGTASSSLTASGAITQAGTFNVGDGTGAAGTAIANVNGGMANSGTVTVKSDGQMNLTTSVTGAGTLGANAGGALNLSNGAGIANAVTNGGTTTVTDGTSVFSGAFTNQAAGTFNVGDAIGGAGTAVASLTGGMANAGTVTVKSDGTLALTSSVSGAGTLATQSGGLLTLANGAGVTNAITNAGTTTVLDGTSALSGAIANTGTVNVGDTVGAAGSAVLNLSASITGVGGTVAVKSDGALNLSNGAGIASAVTNGGTTTVTDGTSVFSGAFTNQAAGTFNVGDAIGGAGTAVASLTGTLANAGSVVVKSDGSLSLAGNVTGSGTLANAGAIVLNTSGATSVNNVISGAGTLTQAGPGTTTLTAVNTYTGTTFVTGGTLVLDYTGGSEIIKSGNALVLGGGEVRFDNLGTTQTQTFSTTLLAASTNSKLTLGTGWTSGVLVDVGTLSSGGGSPTAALEVSDVGTTPSWIKASGNLNEATLLSGAVTTNGGTNLVATDGSGNMVLAAVDQDYLRNAAIPSNPGGNVRFINSGTLGDGDTTVGLVGLSASGTTNVNTLLNAYAAGSSVTVDITNAVTQAGPTTFNAANVLRLGAAGAIVSAAGSDMFTLGVSVADGGGLTAGGVDDAAGTLAFNATDAITVNAAVIDNGTGVVNLTKTGASTLTLNAANTYSGTTTVNQGTLEITADQALGSIAGGTLVNSGGTLLLSNVAYAAAETLTLNGTGVGGIGALRNSGTSSYAGAIVIATDATIDNGGGTLTLTGGIDKTGTTVTFVGSGHTIVGGTGLWASTGVPDSDVDIAAGTVTIASPSNYTGNTTVHNIGTKLLVDSTLDTTGDVTVYDGATLGGTGGTLTPTGTVQIAADSFITGGDVGTVGTLTIANAATVDLNGTYQVDVDYGTGALGDETGDLLRITGAGTLDLSGATFAINALNAGNLPAAGSHYAIKILESNVADGTVPAGQSNYAGPTSGLASYQSIVTWDGGKSYYLVPEPASFALLGLGCLLLLRRPSRRRGRHTRA